MQRIRTRVLIASSRFSTFWLNIYMAILWVAVVGLVIKETLSVPSCMNGIYLIFVINATFRMTDMVCAPILLRLLLYLDFLVSRLDCLFMFKYFRFLVFQVVSGGAHLNCARKV